ncbi:MAG TPA: redoxin domain-containing protein [Dehalococcoidia bacterium]|nr:redoxin domain-containing protein [Dehalococcoidia bacterium]
MSSDEGDRTRSVRVPASHIAVGERAPVFSLPAVDTEGAELKVDVARAWGEGPVLLIFYQDDGMPVCTRELQAFAQEHSRLVKAGVTTFGINTNGLGSHRKFQERDHFPFPLISDFYADTVKEYGFWDPDERKSSRAVVIIAEGGRVSHVEPHFNPGNINAFEEVFRALSLF